MAELTRYEKFKNWCRERKKEITVGACFVLIFLVGFGTGRFDRERQSASRRSKDQTNYNKTTTNQQKPADEPKVAGETVVKDKVDAIEAPAKASSTKSAICVIKGNISAKGGKIYHIKGGAFYGRTNPEMCFNTEDEARAAGFRKSTR